MSTSIYNPPRCGGGGGGAGRGGGVLELWALPSRDSSKPVSGNVGRWVLWLKPVFFMIISLFVGVLEVCLRYMGVSQIWGSLLGLPIMKILVFWGLYRGPLFRETCICRSQQQYTHAPNSLPSKCDRPMPFQQQMGYGSICLCK